MSIMNKVHYAGTENTPGNQMDDFALSLQTLSLDARSWPSDPNRTKAMILGGAEIASRHYLAALRAKQI